MTADDKPSSTDNKQSTPSDVQRRLVFLEVLPTGQIQLQTEGQIGAFEVPWLLRRAAAEVEQKLAREVSAH